MKIALITPAPPQSRAGNRTTALRWARLLGRLGHRVHVAVQYADEPVDAMIALHAWRSAESVVRFRLRHPEHLLILALTGTDLYQFIHTDADITLRSMELADVLIGLHDEVSDAVPEHLRPKTCVIHQSAPPVQPGPPSRRRFDVCVVGHLREVKDPLRTAYAVRRLPASSRIRVVHLGQASSADWAAQAHAEMARNPRYEWRGEVPGWQVRRTLARSRLMVLSSTMEGGANVVSEALMARVPIVASDIPGSRGLLGRSYPGYFPVGDTAALAEVLLRAENDRGFYGRLRRHCLARAHLFRPERELAAWAALLRGQTMAVPAPSVTDRTFPTQA